MNKGFDFSRETDLVKRFKLTKIQSETYQWLKKQNLNTDDNTLCYWVKRYPITRVIEVINYAKARRESEHIKNIGGWINSFLKSGLPVVNETTIVNRKYLEGFISERNWKDIKIYEKYIKDTITNEDLSLTIESEVFKRSLESLYKKSQLYK